MTAETPASDSFLDFLRSRLKRAPFTTEEALASFLPLARDVVQAHHAGLVAPLRGVDHLRVRGIRLWFEAGRLVAPRSAPDRLSAIERPPSLSLEIDEDLDLTADLASGEEAAANRRVGRPGQPIVSPVYLPGYVSWEHEVGHHDALTDLFSLGLVLASLACGLDLSENEDLEEFAGSRGNLFRLNPDLHPVLAKAIARMTELNRHRRAQDLPSLLHALENYRDQQVDLSTALARAGGLRDRPAAGRRRMVFERLRERLFEVSRRNRLLYHRPTLGALNLTFASVPLLFDLRAIRPEQILTWQGDFARTVLEGGPVLLSRYLRFDEAPYAAGVLDRIISEARRDQAEYGFSQLRLVLCFLRWHNLREDKEERIESPLVLLPVKLTRRKGVRDAYVLEAPSPVAEVNPALRYHLRQLYGIELPEAVDLSQATMESLHQQLSSQIQGSEPGVTLNLIDRPHVTLIREKARRRLDQYQRRLEPRGRGLRSQGDLSYSYDRDNFAPLGLKLFLARVRPAKARLGDIARGAFRTREQAAPEASSSERELLGAHFQAGTQGNPYSWDFDLCSVTLGNFRYRKMSLVRDYDELLDRGTDNPSFDRLFDPLFSTEPRPAAPSVASPAIEDRFPVVDCDPTQAAAVAQARSGGSYIIQGPPGTGKSQTITNLIADQVMRGRRVLFVCEKRAALDVVYHRLKQHGLHELCASIHDSQEDKKQLIQDLKGTYEGFLSEVGAEVGASDRDRRALALSIRGELEPLERFDRAMKAVSEDAGVAFRSLLGRLLELTDSGGPSRSSSGAAGPPGSPSFPPYALWAAHRQIIERFLDALREVSPEGVFARHPLSLLSCRLVEEARPVEAAARRLEEARTLLESIRRAVAGLEPDLPETLAALRTRVAHARSLRCLVERGLLDLLDLRTAPSRAFAAAAREVAWRRSALEEASEANRAWRQKLPRAETRLALEQARAVQGLLRFLRPSWWRLRRTLLERYDFAATAVRPTWVQVLERLEEEQRATEEVERAERAAREAYGLEGPFEELAREVEAARKAVEALPDAATARHRALLGRPEAPEVLRRLAGLRPDLDRLEETMAGLLVRAGDVPLERLEEALERVGEALPGLPDFLPCLAELERLPPPLADAFRGLFVEPRRIEAGMARRSVDLALDSDRFLARFSAAAREGHASRLERHHRRWLEANAHCVRDAVRDRFLAHAALSARPAEGLTKEERAFKKSYAAGRKELEHEFGKTMRYRSIRNLLADDAGLVIQDLKPVWLMSPLSVSDTLPLDTSRFDVVVFDEASQIPLEEGVPPLFRAAQAIIVGDTMQLPPTSFFSTKAPEEEELAPGEEGEEPGGELESNSFLAHAARNLPSVMLGWHYRSRSESLISFSNSRFYERRLLTVPDHRLPAERLEEIHAASPEDAARHVEAALDRPISLHLMEKAVYAQRRNAREADYIAHLVRGLLSRETGLTLGVVAFSEAQQGEIDAALQRLADQDPRFRERLERELEREEDGQFVGLLVKNLENIQGDERDVVVLSVCYGPDNHGRMLMNFGPINQSGGEKRLNVAFSRARRHMVVVSSIHGDRITNVYNDGASCLRNYLRYAEAASRGDGRAAGRVLDEVQALREARAGTERHEPVARQLAAELRARGYQVDEGIGQSRMRCDLAVRFPGESTYRAGILLDGEEFYREEDLLARDMMKPAVLRSFGWRLVHVLSKDWFENRPGVLERLERFLRGEEPQAPAGKEAPAAPPEEAPPSPPPAPQAEGPAR